MALSRGPKIITDGLILCLDAADKKSYSGSGTTWYDRSGNDYDGTLINDPTFSDANGGCLVFDGVDDYVNAPLTKSASCTFSFWAKTTTIVTTPMLFNAGASGGGPDLYFAHGKISWNTWNGASNSFASTPASVTDGNYHHYVVVNDSASNAKLYYDGVLLGTATYVDASANTNLTIGGNTASYIWDGNIASTTIYNRAVTASAVLQNFNALKSRFGL